ncbi:MAG: adenylate/guanylate cyclase domain-containing protein [Gemmatimonadota bacterium]|nr:adenylate/guanylate cyclase domain-containing protein [Gemmatimonadota bacterium]
MEADRTILFADVVDSTGITEALGNVVSRNMIAEILDQLASATTAVGGIVIKTIGDEIMCSFESPLDGIAAAVDMQRAVSARLPVNGIHSRVRIGLHSGSVLLESGDVFGDVVNVAARVVGMAAAEQVLTTGETMDLAGQASVPYRSLGVHGVRGRDEQLHLCEILWRGETAQMTVVAPKLDRGPMPELEIQLGDQILKVKAASNDAISLGRGGECTLVVPSTSASRAHADILTRGGRFYLDDHSTNGTYIRPEGANEIFVHRDQALLQGSGLIRLGEPIAVQGPLDVEYRTRYGG